MKTITALALLTSALTVTACNKKEEPAPKPKAGMDAAPKADVAAPATEPVKAQPEKAEPSADDADPPEAEADDPMPGDDLPSEEIEESGDDDMGD